MLSKTFTDKISALEGCTEQEKDFFIEFLENYFSSDQDVIDAIKREEIDDKIYELADLSVGVYSSDLFDWFQKNEDDASSLLQEFIESFGNIENPITFTELFSKCWFMQNLNKLRKVVDKLSSIL